MSHNRDFPPRPQAVRPAAEPLDPRRLLAFTTSVIGGTLQIVPGLAAVDLLISSSLDNIRITDQSDGSSEDIPAFSVLRISAFGTPGNDRIRLQNLNRPATLLGARGNDTLVGGSGNDVLDGGFGNDSIQGGAGSDTADYSSRTANLFLSIGGVIQPQGSSEESDFIAADIENLAGGTGNDVINGNVAANVLQGNGGRDTLNGGEGNDTLSGGNGNDSLDGEGGADSMVGGAGTLDRVTYFRRVTAVSITLDDVANDGASGEGDQITGTSEVFIGGFGDDLIIASGKPNRLEGGLGADTLRGGGGNDSIFGGSGNDSLLGEGGNDFLDGGPDADFINGGSGTDTAVADAADTVINVP